jgi:solute carrier family 45, member 1/2/4
MWAPPTFLGVEVNRLSGASDPNGSYRRLSNDVEMAEMVSPISPALSHVGGGADDARFPAKGGATGELSGVYFGILNIYTTIPQFIGTLLSTVVFMILEPGKSPELAHGAKPEEHHSTEGPNAIAVVLFIGALGAVMAIFATRKLKYL